VESIGFPADGGVKLAFGKQYNLGYNN